MEQQDWMSKISRAIAGEIRRHRLERGLSAQQLSDRCAELGVTIPRVVISNIENGKRQNVTVAEVLVLAQVLSVPPGVLVFPVGHEEQVEILPNSLVDPLDAVEWLSGHRAFSDEAAAVFEESPLKLTRLHQDQAVLLQRAISSRDRYRDEHVEWQLRYAEVEEDHQAARLRAYTLEKRIRELEKSGSDVTEEREQMQAELKQALQAATVSAEGSRRYEQAQRAVRMLEHTVTKYEDEVRRLRDKMKRGGLKPPLLPRSLQYLDPENPSREDVVGETSYSISWSEKNEMERREIPMSESGEKRSLISADSDREIRGVIEGIKPYLADALEEAMSRVAEKRKESEGD